MSHNGFSIRVPATSANLGPGFDAVGVALSLQLQATVRPARRFSLAFTGPHAPTHDGYARIICDAIAMRAPALPRVCVEVHNEIPLGKGLGSSAAAAVLGLTIAQRCTRGRVDRRSLARDAAALEGHADNAFAAVYGGTVITASSTSIALEAPHHLHALIAIPDVSLSTKHARALLPETYTRDDAAFTSARALLLGAALARKDWRALAQAMQDRLHQPYRAAAIPGLQAALSLAMPGLVGIALSGAGPSVLALVHARDRARVGAALTRCFSDAGVASVILDLRFSARGLLVSRA